MNDNGKSDLAALATNNQRNRDLEWKRLTLAAIQALALAVAALNERVVALEGGRPYRITNQ